MAARSKCEPAYRNAELSQADPEGMIADYLAGRAVLVRRSEDPGRFCIQSAIPDGGAEFEFCGAEGLVDMVRFHLARPDGRPEEGIGTRTENESQNAIKAGGVSTRAGALRLRSNIETIFAARDLQVDAFTAIEGDGFSRSTVWGWVAIPPEEPEGPAPEFILVDDKRFNVVGIETRDGRRGYLLHRREL